MAQPESETITCSRQGQQRSTCGSCDRPVRHPLEARHKLNTASILTKSLVNASLITARRLSPDFNHPLLSQNAPTFYLFPPSPSSPAVALSQLRGQLSLFDEGGGTTSTVNLIIFDATWKHAKEMVSASEEYLSRSATRVCLDGFDAGAEGASIFDSELILRKEPCAGCVSTAEAAARWLAAVEEKGDEIEDRLVGVLREMVRLQAQFIKPMNPRPKMLKKNKRQTQTVAEEDATG